MGLISNMEISSLKNRRKLRRNATFECFLNNKMFFKVLKKFFRKDQKSKHGLKLFTDLKLFNDFTFKWDFDSTNR